MSRPTTAHLFSSVNGISENPHLFQFGAFGPEEAEMMTRTLAPVTDVVIGRILWQQWSQFWPGKDDPFGAFINPVRKHVISSSLTGGLPWNSELIDGDPAGYVRSLREQDGGAISVVGGVSTVRSLFLAGLIDRLTLTVHPAVTNDGQRLFDESVPLTRLKLEDGVVTGAGNAILTYSLLPDAGLPDERAQDAGAS